MFAENLNRKETKLISPNANISLLSIKASAPISNTMLQSCIMPTVRQIICVTTRQIV